MQNIEQFVAQRSRYAFVGKGVVDTRDLLLGSQRVAEHVLILHGDMRHWMHVVSLLIQKTQQPVKMILVPSGGLLVLGLDLGIG